MSELLKQALKRGPECPAPEVLIEALESPNNAAEVRKHVAGCPACQAEVALFQGFESPTPVSGEERQAIDFIVARLNERMRPPQKESLFARLFSGLTVSSARMGAFAMAAAVVILGVGLTTQWRARQVQPVAETGVVRSAKIRMNTPLENLTSAPSEISWQPVEGAATYEVSVAEVDRTVVFYNKFTSSVLQVPVELGRLLVPGKTLAFRVTARDAAGKELATTGALDLKVEVSGR